MHDMHTDRRFEIEFGGRPLIVEVGTLAKQAHGSCTVRYGDTMILATAVMGMSAREGMDYFPLTVDYEEKLYAAGKIKGSRFIKREGRPSDEAVLVARLVDRSMRPLFDERVRNEVQIILTALSWDEENDPEFPSLLAASIALAISKIPWKGPVAGIKIGRINGEWVINPTYTALMKSELELLVSFTEERNVIMIEAGAEEVPEQIMIDAIAFASKHIEEVFGLIEKVRIAAGVEKLVIETLISKELSEASEPESAQELEQHQAVVREIIDAHVDEYLFNQPVGSKIERKNKLKELKALVEMQLTEKQIGKEKRQKAMAIVESYIEQHISRAIIEGERRVDGRSLTDIRALETHVGVLPRVHGSGLFNRGETQVLSIVTLGSPGDEQVLDTMEESSKKRYMHHYNFPGFSVGEPKRVGSPGRREIGHGALAEKALVPVLPPKEEFPYTIRVVSEVLGSNGSSSMGSVCGSTLALMDAGVPIRKPVAGIAMGLATSETGAYKVLTDLQDLEDGPGGMDFKIAGTRDGITAIQMDTKTRGLTMPMIEMTFQQAYKARLEILDQMQRTIPEPRAELSPYAPRITSLKVHPDKIREIIGTGGKMINAIIDATGVDIDIEDDGTVMITSVKEEGAMRATAIIKEIVREFIPGEMLQGVVSRIESFGAFVAIEHELKGLPESIKLPKQEGLVHISAMAPFHVDRVEDIVKLGDRVPVRVVEIDDMGRLNLSLKDTDFAFPDPPEHGRGPRQGDRPLGGRPFRGGNRHGGSRHGDRTFDRGR